MLLSPDFSRIRLAEVEENAASSIWVDLNKYQDKMRLEMAEIINWMEEKRNRLSQFELTENLFQRIKTELAEYPRLEILLKGVRSKNAEALRGEISKLWSWMTSEGVGWDRYLEVRQAVTALTDYSESLENVEERYSTSQAENQLQQIMRQTTQNMNKIESLVREAIDRIPDWQGHSVVIEAQPPSSDPGRDRYRFEPADDATVSLEVGGYPPSFSLFMHEENTVVIDDVLEGGDPDFFTDVGSQTDYFNLVNELRNPGSTQKTKLLILYTARPTSDREMFEKTQTLPVNIFLTDSFDHAMGLASELGGSQGTRDVWRVRINSRFLTQTLEGPVNYYQVTTPDAPVKEMTLVHAE